MERIDVDPEKRAARSLQNELRHVCIYVDDRGSCCTRSARVMLQGGTLEAQGRA